MSRAYPADPRRPADPGAPVSPAPRTEGTSLPGRDRAPERCRSSGALVGDRCQLPVVFFAGTAVGLAGRAVRARVTVDEVAFAGALLAAGLLFLAGAGSAGVGLAGVAFAVTGLAPESGASTAFSAVALVDSAASSTFSSALAATLLA